MDIFFLIAGPLFVWAIASYKLLTRDNKRVLSAWGHIDVQLRRRYDLTIELVDLIKRHAHHEQAALRAITSANQLLADSTNAHQRGKFETKISSRIKRLLAIVDAYPELESSQHFLALQQQLAQIESKLRFARRHYNEAVRNLNKRIDRFPDNIIAHLSNHTHHFYFQSKSHAHKPLPEPHRGGLQNSHC